MTVATHSKVKVDPRIEAFCAPAAHDAFTTVVHPNSLWKKDPFDVETIHADARDTFGSLLGRAAGPEVPEHGKIFLIRGTSGSGKTHLLRALRHHTHSQSGYAGYLQMISQSGDYARYVLSYLIDALDQPYEDQAGSSSALLRLAQSVIDSIASASAEERGDLCESILDGPDTLRLVERLTDFAVQEGRYDDRDLDMIRVLLFLLSTDKRMKSRVTKWMRCEELTPSDREFLGGLAGQTMDGAALRMIAGLGRVMAAQGAPLVLLVDQLEETFDVSADELESGRRFRQAVDTLVNIAAHVPNAVVVVACLDVYYQLNRQKLPEPKLHRLEKETEPITLKANRNEDEIACILERRLRYLYDLNNLAVDEASPLFPFQRSHLQPLAGKTIRAALLDFHQHQQRCQKAGTWIEPAWSSAPDGPEDPDPNRIHWAQRWNDFLGGYDTPVLDEEEELAELLSSSINKVSAELQNGERITADHGERFIEVTFDAGTAAEKLLVAICDKNARGGGLKRQIEDTVKRTGEIPAVFIRSTPFPATRSADTVKLMAQHLSPRGNCRRVVVSNSDWRALAAFQRFFLEHAKVPTFREWQRQDRPLSGLAVIHDTLALNKRLSKAASAKADPPSPPPLPPSPIETPASRPVTLPAPMPLGRTRSATSVPFAVEAPSLTRHAAFIGSPGSGKTTAALAIIEQLLFAGIPVVMLDRKGDLSRYADPSAWTAPEADAGRATRRTQLRSAIDVALYTPGTEQGRALAIPVLPPDLTQVGAVERDLYTRFSSAALGVMMGFKSRGVDPKLVILQKALEVLASASGQTVTLKAVQRLVQDRDEALLTLLDGQYEDRHFKNLGTELLTLSHMHKNLLDGTETLDVDSLLGRRTGSVRGKTRLSIINTQFLGDAQAQDFWVAQFLIAIDRWKTKNPAPGNQLQAVFFFDEADIYLPAVGKPATKGPMESLLKRSRSAGIGYLLATQSPGDFDYKCRDQVLTWFIGLVRESVAVNKLKPMLEGKPGAADKLASQKAGEFYVVREQDVLPVSLDRNLLPTEQLPDDRILELARATKR